MIDRGIEGLGARVYLLTYLLANSKKEMKEYMVGDLDFLVSLGYLLVGMEMDFLLGGFFF